MDIEDLKEFAKEKGFCPYYMHRETKNISDLVVMPYNYLFSFNRLG